MLSYGTLVFVIDMQGIPPQCLVLVTSGAYACSTSGLLYLHIFESCCLRLGLLMSLNLGAEILLFGTLKGRGTSSTTGRYKKYNKVSGQAQKF